MSEDAEKCRSKSEAVAHADAQATQTCAKLHPYARDESANDATKMEIAARDPDQLATELLPKRPDGRVLSRTERKIWHALTGPATWNLTADGKIKAAGCSSAWFYHVTGLSWFAEPYKRFCNAILNARRSELYEAAITTATTPGRDGHADRRMLLAMTGDYTPRQRQDVNINHRVLIGVVGVDMSEL